MNKKFSTKKLILTGLLLLPLSIPIAVLAQDMSSGSSSSGSNTPSSTPSTLDKTANYIDDSALTTKVKTALLAKKHLQSTGISVQSTAGIVTLSGTVPTKRQIAWATKVTKTVDGVKDVHNVLTVDPGSSSS